MKYSSGPYAENTIASPAIIPYATPVRFFFAAHETKYLLTTAAAAPANMYIGTIIPILRNAWGIPSAVVTDGSIMPNNNKIRYGYTMPK